MKDIGVYSCKCVATVRKMASEFEEKESVAFGIATLVSKTTCCLRLVFLLHQGVVLKGSFYCIVW